jgi:hypothetical protein
MDDDRVEKVLAVIRQNVPRGERVNKEFYLNVLKRFREAVFFLFPELKSSLKGRRFHTVKKIEENSIRDLRAIPQNAFQNWKKRWEL